MAFCPRSRRSVTYQRYCGDYSGRGRRVFFSRRLRSASCNNSVRFTSDSLFTSLFTQRDCLQGSTRGESGSTCSEGSPRRNRRHAFKARVFVVLLFLIVGSRRQEKGVFFFRFPSHVFTNLPTPFHGLGGGANAEP